MLKKARLLRDINVTFISLVDKGANNKTIIWKAAGAPAVSPEFVREIALVKADDEKRLVYGIVYAPGELDAHEDTATADEIEKAAHFFMKAARTGNVDQQHDLEADKGYVAESWIVRKGDALFEEEGAWAVAIKVEDDETWALVKSGEISGISLYGTASIQEIEKSMSTEIQEKEAGPVERLRKWLSEKAGLLKKDFTSQVNRSQLSDAVYALFYSLEDILWDQSIENKRAALVAEAGKFTSFITSNQDDTLMKEEDAGKTIAEEPSALEAQVQSLTKSVEALTGLVETLVKSAEAPPEEAPRTEEASPVEEVQPAEEVEKSGAEETAKTIKELAARIEALEKSSLGRQSKEVSAQKQEAPAVKGIPFI